MTTDPDAQPPTARVRHEFKLPAEAVFDAWLDPETVRRWMGQMVDASVGGSISRVEIDPRVGGRFVFADVRDGHEAVHAGTYLEIDRPRRLSFTWETEASAATTVIVNIRSTSFGCELELVHEMDPDWADAVEQTSKGWTAMLASIDDVLHSGPASAG